MTEKIIVQEPVRTSGKSIYILIPKSVKDSLGIKPKHYKFEFDPETKITEITFY